MLRVHSSSISVDGYGAGPSQNLENPLGAGGPALFDATSGMALIDELQLAIAPVLLGAGEHLLNGIDLPALGYECTDHVAGDRATHVILSKRRP